MPQLGLEVTHGTVSALFVEPGATVTRDQPLLELDTDKASTDVVAPADGVVRSIDVVVGQEVEIGARLIVLAQTAEEPVGDRVGRGTAGRGVADRRGRPRNRRPRRGGPTGRRRLACGWRRSPAVPPRTSASTCRRSAGPVRAAGSPWMTCARRRIDRPRRRRPTAADPRQHRAPCLPELSDRPRGRPGPARARDVDRAFVQEASPLRRAIARRMSASQLIPQYQLVRDVDAGPLLAESAARKAAAGSGPAPGVNDLLMQAIAEMVRRHPGLATSYVADAEATTRQAGPGHRGQRRSGGRHRPGSRRSRDPQRRHARPGRYRRSSHDAGRRGPGGHPGSRRHVGRRRSRSQTSAASASIASPRCSIPGKPRSSPSVAPLIVSCRAVAASPSCRRSRSRSVSITAPLMARSARRHSESSASCSRGAWSGGHEPGRGPRMTFH